MMKGLGREPTYEEQIQVTQYLEWFYYFVLHLLDRSPEQRFQERKRNPCDHHSSKYIRNLDRYDGKGCNQFTGCVPECRFYPGEGRIENLEILEYYKDYKGYD